MRTDAVEPAGDKLRNRALRLLFQYEGDDVKLVSVQPVKMLAPPPQALIPTCGERGSWFELRDREGKPLYRRAFENPMARDLEVLTEDPERPLGRIKVERPSGTFFLVVPNVPEARKVLLSTSRLPQERVAGRAEAVADRAVQEFDLPEYKQED
jgi:hypothetical protein